MCGICGFTGEDKKLIGEMTSIIAHRGPDQQGIYHDKYISLGHRRLSIIDLSEKGRQPMTNENQDMFIVFNGEIYNFQELKSLLEQKGHQFNSSTDTEVILHAYEEWGMNCLNRLNGMFAFAIWDTLTKKLFLARDRAGVKPLYYALKGGELIFASELKAVLLYPGISRALSRQALNQYLTFRYMPGSQSIFNDIKKLMPGHYLLFDAVKKTAECRPYWDISFQPESGFKGAGSIRAVAARLHKAVKSSVKSQLMSDVPLGAFLSGGLDSSYVVGLMAQLVEEPIKTFSIGFGHGKGYDETKFSRLVSEAYDTDHREIILREDAFSLLPKILWHMDEPIADFAAIPNYVLSEFAKKKVSVVLTGEGADEIFGGYRKYKYLSLIHQYRRLMPSKLREIAGQCIEPMMKSPPYQRLLDIHNSPSFPAAYLNLISFFTDREKAELTPAPALNPNSASNSASNPALVESYLRGNLMHALMKLDFKTWLPEDVLTKVDKTTMAHSLESRVPFLDNEVVALAEKIPSSLKIRFLKEKFILRKAMQTTVPKEIVRRKKHGFNVPIHSWLETDLKGIAQELLSKESLAKRKLFSYSYVEKLWNSYKSAKVYYSRQLWTLLNFELWSRIYLDREDIADGDILLKDVL
ncbi:asparagine synthase (glutamine-hydrolyzing) [Candidatus Woesearchaeota archaeon]|nr:asparagine synthase (glutamine-hydrolyzing) [Candidatus Woesearchaeota archaeon]